MKKPSTLQVKPPTPQPAGGRVQPEKHTVVRTDRGQFSFREPKSQDWK